MSVKRTVASTRSTGTGAREPVKNSSIASAISVALSPTKRYVVFSRKLDIARAGNVLGQITSTLDVDGHVFGSMDDKRRHPDRWQDTGNIDLAVHAHEGGSSGRACAKPLKPAPPALKGRIIGARWRKVGQAATGAPGLIGIAEKTLLAPPP